MWITTITSSSDPRSAVRNPAAILLSKRHRQPFLRGTRPHNRLAKHDGNLLRLVRRVHLIVHDRLAPRSAARGLVFIGSHDPFLRTVTDAFAAGLRDLHARVKSEPVARPASRHRVNKHVGLVNGVPTVITLCTAAFGFGREPRFPQPGCPVETEHGPYTKIDIAQKKGVLLQQLA